jgi:hypothetical protein
MISMKSCLLFVVLVLGVPSIHAQQSCIPPPQIAQVLSAQWPGWHILQLDDLYPDDRALWKHHWRSACPGLTTGHYIKPGSKSYALALIKDKQEAVIIIPDSGSLADVHVVIPPCVGVFCVVHTLPPGKYSDAERTQSMSVTTDSIAFEHIESGMTMYYWKAGRFRSLELSE